MILILNAVPIPECKAIFFTVSLLTFRWPFRGNITIQLLNQRRNEGHFAETVVFTHDTTQEVAGRVQHGEVAESGLGIPKFIPHSQLGYNATKNIQYLQNSCLRFHVSKVEVSR